MDPWIQNLPGTVRYPVASAGRVGAGKWVVPRELTLSSLGREGIVFSASLRT